MNYFWLNCGYNRFNHFEDLTGQISIFDSSVHFNPSEGYAAFKRAQIGDKVIFYQVQNKLGLLGAGTVIKFEEPRRGQIKIHFKYEEKLLPLTKDYLERNDQLKISLFRMKEQLLNQINKEDYELIMALGRGEEKIDRYFLIKEMENFQPDEKYTIFTKTVNGIERNGFRHYKEMQRGDKVIIYRTAPERGIYGTAIVEESIHKKPVMMGRTDTTAITIKYTGDIEEPRTIYDLDREPMLRAQYFVEENWNESVTELTKIQYEAMLHPSEEEEAAPITSYAEQLAKAAPKKSSILKYTAGEKKTKEVQHIELKKSGKLIHIFINSHFTPKVLEVLKLDESTPHAVADKHWTQGMLYGQYVKEGEDTVIKNGLITDALNNQTSLIIEDIEHVESRYLKPLIYAAAGKTIELGYDQATIGGENATYKVTEDFKLVGITSMPLEKLKQHFAQDIHPYIKVYQLK
ncbi:EVE domain-containing protein [Macrococcus carouselicus]|uniref:EVE domain-containing protein n=1 Tax=Macrococcus carouselicus TaxID=69969 RepID=A0A9Q8CHW7_9STAP|nr:EVE domain-containing protein [Macrococcus carouselicus]TDM00800.1 EVE domain-containing protein [Macrococcus carouselicus]